MPLMLTCLVLVDDPPRCSECRKKIEMTVLENNTDESTQKTNSNDYNVKFALENTVRSKSKIR